MQELWRPVVGWEGLYEVSNLGRVRSVDHFVYTRNKWNTFRKLHRGRVLRAKIDRYGYSQVRLSGGDRQTFSWRAVHQLVADAFIGQRPDGQQVRHGPLGKTVNTPSNLCYGTTQQNSEDRIRDGNSGKGVENPNVRLTQDQVVAIYNYPRYRGSGRELAARYGVRAAQISKIRKGQSWSWLTSKP